MRFFNVRTRSFIISLLLLVVLTILSHKLFAQAQNTQAGGAAKFYGDVALLSDWRENGVTQTNKNYALQTGFGYQWPVLRLGLWGSNASFPDSNENLNLRPHLQFLVPMTQNVAFGFKYVLNQYYSNTTKNGTILGFNFVVYSYNITYEQKTNWLGIGTLTSYGFAKEYPFIWGTTLDLQVHYNMINSGGYTNFLDVTPEMKYKMADAYLVFALSYNNNAGQFSGLADMNFFYGLRAKF